MANDLHMRGATSADLMVFRGSVLDFQTIRGNDVMTTAQAIQWQVGMPIGIPHLSEEYIAGIPAVG